MVAKAGEAIRTAWPVAVVGLAVAVNGVWIAALGYGILKVFLIARLNEGSLPADLEFGRSRGAGADLTFPQQLRQLGDVGVLAEAEDALRELGQVKL